VTHGQEASGKSDRLSSNHLSRVLKWLTSMISKYADTTARALRGLFEYEILRHFRPLAPTILFFPVTYRCNSHCVMCNIWQHSGGELTLDQIDRMLDDPLFGSIEHVTLTGGEPTLRRDLGQIARLLVEKCRNLRHLGIDTNGLDTRVVSESCNSIANACKGSNVTFDFIVSLDGLGEIHDRVRGIPNAFKKVTQTIKELREKDITLGINCTVSKFNVYGISELKKWCDQERIPRIFTVAQTSRRLYNSGNNFSMSTEQMEYFTRFLSILLREQPFGAHYWMTCRMFKYNKRRHLTCPFVVDAIGIYPDGEFHYCPRAKPIGNVLEQSVSQLYYHERNIEYRKLVEKNECPSCVQNWVYYIASKKGLAYYLDRMLLRTYYGTRS